MRLPDRGGAYPPPRPRPGLLNSDSFDLAEVSKPADALEHAILDERGHPFGLRVRQHLGDARLGLDEPLHLVGRDEQLVDGGPAAVAGLAARAAALPAVEHERLVVFVALGQRGLAERLRELVVLGAVGMVLRLAVLADALDEPLRICKDCK